MYEPDGWKELHDTVLGIRCSKQDICGVMQRHSISSLLHTHGRAKHMGGVRFLATRSQK